MRAAAATLSSAHTIEGLSEVVRAAGLASTFAFVNRAEREALGLEAARPLQLAAGIGSTRVLLVELGDSSLRDELQRVARRLQSRAPHVLWLIAALDVNGGHAAIAAVVDDARGARLASFLWEPTRVLASDAETLCALASVRGEADVVFHTRCVEVLGRDALTRRFYRALESQVTTLAASIPARHETETSRAIALLYTSRLLFLHFLEAKGWLDGDRAFVARCFDECLGTGGEFHRRVLLPLFFGTLNTPPARRARAAVRFGRIPFLNGGLFTRTALERRVGNARFSDAHLGEVLAQLFQRFRFVAREDSALWSEASVDPEMLGRAFESLMAAGERKTAGVYYTPHDLVARVTDQALAAAFAAPSLGALARCRVLDPACGSGAFLVHALERLAAIRSGLGDGRPVHAIRREVLARSIFGVDRNPTAVWLCELRLWLSVVIESDEPDPMRVPPLPNLDRNIRVGDALVGASFDRRQAAVIGSARVAAMRERYVRATGTRKQNIARALDREERRRALAQLDRELGATQHARRERLAAERTRDLFGQRIPPSMDARRELKRLRDRWRALRAERRRISDGGALPFSFGACFAEVQAHGGFDVVLGNPPWVRLHRIPAALRLRFKHEYEVFRAAPWESGAAGARVAPGFASQVDLAALFVERSLVLAREGGVVSLLLPAKLWRSLAGGGLRALLLQRTRVLRLEDLSESKHAFDAAVYPSLLVTRTGVPPAKEMVAAIHDRSAHREWTIRSSDLPYDASPGAPWLVLPPDARRAFDRVRNAGIALAASPLGPPRLGVKSGCNSAFVVRVMDTTAEYASIVDADGERGVVETCVLRPALSGDLVAAWKRAPCTEWILWTHDDQGVPLARLPDRCRAWLRRRYGELSARSDAARSRRWWSLFRVDAATPAHARVVWADFGKHPRALVLPPGDRTVPLNTCYVVRCADPCDAAALAALLNSRLASAWLNAVAEPARGGYRRYLAWTVGLLPLPRDWHRARHALSAVYGETDDRVLDATLEAYGLARSSVVALLEWGR
jgi:hypothetical protein